MKRLLSSAIAALLSTSSLLAQVYIEGKEGTQYSSINAAITDAASGDVIVVTENTSLQGASASNARICPAVGSLTIKGVDRNIEVDCSAADVPILVKTCQSLIIQDLTFTKTTDQEYNFILFNTTAGNQLHLKGVTFRGINITVKNRPLIYSNVGAKLILEDCTFEDCTFPLSTKYILEYSTATGSSLTLKGNNRGLTLSLPESMVINVDSLTNTTPIVIGMSSAQWTSNNAPINGETESYRFEADDYHYFFTETYDEENNVSGARGQQWVVETNSNSTNAYNDVGHNTLVVNPSVGSITSNSENIITRTDEGYTAPSMHLYDNEAYYSGFNIYCNEITFTREGLTPGKYVTALLPFTLIANKASDVYVLSSISADTLRFEPVTGDVAPYTPLLIKPQGEFLTLYGRVMEAAATVNLFNFVDIKGNGGAAIGDGWKAVYTNRFVETNVGEDDFLGNYNVYGISNGAFRMATGKVTARPFRAFFVAEKSTVQEAPASFSIEVNDGTSQTIVIAPDQIDDSEELLFDLSGRPARPGQRGILVGKGVKKVGR